MQFVEKPPVKKQRVFLLLIVDKLNLKYIIKNNSNIIWKIQRAFANDFLIVKATALNSSYLQLSLSTKV